MQREDAAEAHGQQRQHHDPVERVVQGRGAHDLHDEVGDVEVLGQADREADPAQRHRDEDIQQHQKSAGAEKAAQGAKALSDLGKDAHGAPVQNVVIEIDAGEDLKGGKDRNQYHAQQQDHKTAPAQEQIREICRGKGRAAGLGHKVYKLIQPPCRNGQQDA